MKLPTWLGGAVAVLLVAVAGMWIVGPLLPVDAWPAWRDVRVEILSEDPVPVQDPRGTVTYPLERPRPRTLVIEIVSPGLPFGGPVDLVRD